jgi:hypothetical protein
VLYVCRWGGWVVAYRKRNDDPTSNTIKAPVLQCTEKGLLFLPLGGFFPVVDPRCICVLFVYLFILLRLCVFMARPAGHHYRTPRLPVILMCPYHINPPTLRHTHLIFHSPSPIHATTAPTPAAALPLSLLVLPLLVLLPPLRNDSHPPPTTTATAPPSPPNLFICYSPSH